MTIVSFDHVGAGPLVDIHGSYDAGLHAMLMLPDEGDALVDLVSGRTAARTGRVLLDGASPHRSPEHRARVASVLREEPPLRGRNVVAALARDLGDLPRAQQALQGAGLATWADRRPDHLSRADLRSLALAISLTLPTPAVLALFEPLALLPGLGRSRILEHLQGVARRGGVVLVATASVRDALCLEGTVTVVHRGRVVRRTPALASSIAPGQPTEFVVRTAAARELAARLAHHEAVSGIAWNGQIAPHEVRIRASRTELASRAIMAAARDAHLTIESLTIAEPSLDTVEAASLAAVRAIAAPVRPPPPSSASVPSGSPPPGSPSASTTESVAPLAASPARDETHRDEGEDR